MEKLMDFTDGQVLSGGLFPSVPDNQKLLWKTGSNVEFTERRVQKAKGYTVELVPSGTPVAITQAFADGNRRAYFATVDSVYSWQNGLLTRLNNGYTGFYWSLEPFGTWLLATNETEPPQIWKNGAADSMTDLTGIRPGSIYRLIKKHREHVFGYFAQRAEWSSESDPETWVPDVGNSAGGEDIRDLDSDIIAACPIGPDFALYSGNTMVLQRYIGEPFYFGFEKVLDGIGASSDFAVIPRGNLNYGHCDKGFWRTDGVSFDYIDNPQVNRFVKENYDTNFPRRVAGVHDEETEKLKWFLPKIGGGRFGVGYNEKTGAWTIFDQPVYALAEKEVFPYALVGTPDSFGFMTGDNAGDSAMDSSLVTFPLDAGQRGLRKQWDMLQVDFEGTIEYRLGYHDDLKEAPSWTSWSTLEAENWPDRESAFLQIEFRGNDLDSHWEIEGLSVHGEITGLVR